MTLLFCQSHLSPEILRVNGNGCNGQRQENRYAVFGYGAVRKVLRSAARPVPADTMAGLTQSLSFCSAAAPLITEGLKGNPRLVKRFLNAFVLRKQLAKIAKLTNVDDSILVKLMISSIPKTSGFANSFSGRLQQEGQPKEIVGLERALRGPDGSVDNEEEAKQVNSEWSSSLARRWIAMDPALSGIDLRDYFWVTRDRLQTSLTGLSMVSPLVRRVFESLLSNSPMKRTAAVSDAAGLQDEEREALFRLLNQHIVHKTDREGRL